MRAAVHDRYGAPGVVRVADIETPPVGVNQVRVRVRFATVNRTDCGFRAAKPFFIRAMTGILRPKARVLGTEFAGTIDALGSKAGAFTLGERVFGYSERAFGAHAQYLTLSQDGALARIPADVNDEEAAAATEGYRYAQTLVRTARIQPGDAVLVNGATGGIGSAALQILRGLNAEVTAVCDRQYFDLVTR
jgi:NADPH:quinone reductase-like Zn-dependent oxidoreductase